MAAQPEVPVHHSECLNSLCVFQFQSERWAGDDNNQPLDGFNKVMGLSCGP